MRREKGKRTKEKQISLNNTYLSSNSEHESVTNGGYEKCQNLLFLLSQVQPEQTGLQVLLEVSATARKFFLAAVANCLPLAGLVGSLKI